MYHMIGTRNKYGVISSPYPYMIDDAVTLHSLRGPIKRPEREKIFKTRDTKGQTAAGLQLCNLFHSYSVYSSTFHAWKRTKQRLVYDKVLSETPNNHHAYIRFLCRSVWRAAKPHQPRLDDLTTVSHIKVYQDVQNPQSFR